MNERDFLAGVVNLHSVRGKPPRCITVEHVLHSVSTMSATQITITLDRMQQPNHRKCMKRCTQIHTRLWKEYNECSD